ncbi:hypothetical protein [Salinibaculum rarum]|uniref:hypothetical protein n=1 Tax=Salinibaculum rarum TaxID=3058903 RepID=UPI0026600FE5|nr:hypothetical protein [Salinibaculum sp. KK48]
MNVRTRVLTVDFSLAAGATSIGALGTGRSVAWAIGIGVFGATIVWSSLYLTEQTPVLTVVAERRPLSHIGAFALSLALGFVLVLGWTVVASPAATLLLGMGLGLGLYRTRYGLLGPIPRRRIEQARGTDAFSIDPPSGQS